MTDFLSRVTPFARVVLLVPLQKQAYFQKRFVRDGVDVVAVDTELSRKEIFLRQIALALSNTNGLYIKKRSKWHADRKHFAFLCAMLPAFVVGNTKLGPWIVRKLNLLLLNTHRFDSLLTSYNPDLVFSTDVQNELDADLMTEAKKRGIDTVGMVRSWDNMTSKGLLRILPDRFVVHNEIIKSELARFNGVEPASVTPVGIPHYDRYVRPTHTERAAFLADFGLDPKKKTVLYAPVGDRYVRDNGLDLLVIQTLRTLDCNVLVRLPPTDSVTGAKTSAEAGHVAVYETGVRPWSGEIGGGAKTNEIGEADEALLIDSLTFADVVVTGQSTIVIDAAAFDRPTVIVGFDDRERVYWDSVLRYYDFEYYLSIRESGGIAFAESPTDLLLKVGQYFADPRKDHDGRTRLVTEQIGAFDGRATERLARAVLKDI